MHKKRLLFSKSGRAIYISHLDLMRTMQRAFRRADIDLRHSEGYNPHPIMSIILPLSLGQASRCELMDFELSQDMVDSDIVLCLNRCLPEGILAVEAYDAVRKAKELKWLRVVGRFEYDAPLPPEIATEMNHFFQQKELVILQKTKRTESQSDIAPAIRSVKVFHQEDAVMVEAVISAQEPTLNPERLVSALKQLRPELAPDFAFFERIELFDADMQNFR